MTEAPTSWLFVLSVLAALFPVLIGTLTSYAKVSVVLGMLRNGIGTPQVPSGMVIMACALAISGFIMAPTLRSSLAELEHVDLAVLSKAPTASILAALNKAAAPWRAFLLAHSGERERSLLARVDPSLKHSAEPHQLHELEMRLLVAAFVVTELKSAFVMAFVLLVPFLVVDIVVANLLVGMGMTMVNPASVSLPIKLLLFVAADGWLLVTRGLILSYSS